jgi:hypothetical protein
MTEILKSSSHWFEKLIQIRKQAVLESNTPDFPHKVTYLIKCIVYMLGVRPRGSPAGCSVNKGSNPQKIYSLTEEQNLIINL